MSPPGLVVIVNWRAADLAIASLAALDSEIRQLGNWRVIVVDNCSMDGSAERIDHAIRSNEWGTWAHLLQAPANGGFASGNNHGISYALDQGFEFEFVFLLNPDTEIRDGAIKALLDFVSDEPRIGIVGGRSEDPDGTPQACCFAFPTLTRELSSGLRLGLFDRLFSRQLKDFGIPDKPVEVGWVSGAAMLIRRDVIDQIGGLDRGFFLYFEETDFTLRAARAGFRCWHVPASRVIHHVGKSSGISSRDMQPPRRPGYWFESRRRYYVLNHGVIYAALADMLFLLGYFVWRVRRRLQGKPDTDPPHFGRDLLRHSALLRGGRDLQGRETDLRR